MPLPSYWILKIIDRRTAGALILDLTYGYKIEEDGNDPLVDLADKVVAFLRPIFANLMLSPFNL